MKTRWLKLAGLFFLMVGGTVSMAQDAEVPGDNFSMEGALELFKKSESPEAFERLLNAEDSKVNNLDLNGDGFIDYIRVIDRNEGNVHTFTLQAVISDNEVQDVAVIALEKKTNGKAVLQIIGDEDIYGMETIIEPTQEVKVNAGVTTTQTVVNVSTWPSVQYIYGPSYTVWVSPWSWAYRPVWWYSWHPVVYYRYDSWWSPYRPYYTYCYSPRIRYARDIYRPYRSTSVIVHSRHRGQVDRYRTTHGDDYRRRRDDYRTADRNDYRADRNGNNSVRPRRDDGNNNNRPNTSSNENRRPQREVNRQTPGNRESDVNRREPVNREHNTVNRESSDRQREVSRPVHEPRRSEGSVRQQQAEPRRSESRPSSVNRSDSRSNSVNRSTPSRSSGGHQPSRSSQSGGRGSRRSN